MDCDMYKVLALSEQSLFVECHMHMEKPQSYSAKALPNVALGIEGLMNCLTAMTSLQSSFCYVLDKENSS